MTAAYRERSSVALSPIPATGARLCSQLLETPLNSIMAASHFLPAG
jgi:hypothetical protein